MFSASFVLSITFHLFFPPFYLHVLSHLHSSFIFYTNIHFLILIFAKQYINAYIL